MAQKTYTELIDDVDGSKAEETVRFSLDGVAYEIDLSADNAAKIRDDLSGWTAPARRVAGRRIRGTGKTASSDSESAKIREWARSTGREVSTRGRIPADLREAYHAAH